MHNTKQWYKSVGSSQIYHNKPRKYQILNIKYYNRDSLRDTARSNTTDTVQKTRIESTPIFAKEKDRYEH